MVWRGLEAERGARREALEVGVAAEIGRGRAETASGCRRIRDVDAAEIVRLEDVASCADPRCSGRRATG